LNYTQQEVEKQKRQRRLESAKRRKKERVREEPDRPGLRRTQGKARSLGTPCRKHRQNQVKRDS